MLLRDIIYGALRIEHMKERRRSNLFRYRSTIGLVGKGLKVVPFLILHCSPPARFSCQTRCVVLQYYFGTIYVTRNFLSCNGSFAFPFTEDGPR